MAKLTTFIKGLWRRYEDWLRRWGLDQTSCSRCVPQIREHQLQRPPADEGPQR